MIRIILPVGVVKEGFVASLDDKEAFEIKGRAVYESSNPLGHSVALKVDEEYQYIARSLKDGKHSLIACGTEVAVEIHAHEAEAWDAKLIDFTARKFASKD